ncbi:hypothetical protein E4U24_005599 [Claviceps purpurea]|nr:hypothetical protein E4U38_002152 [Claviceps purpurea]KAG6230233.1 hypothetical protein E4U34_001115 [Claviceps purpurea]KAG6242841.1 hypothetical protein E4U24_005599 [Claviceps purpurea]KAG6254225.1 hypothetical protein E4U23_006596 [Claviceps purpurea]
MGTTVFLALRGLLCTIRSLQLLCATLVLAMALHEYGLQIDVGLRAVEGISGAAVLYTLINMLCQCCLTSGLGCMSPVAAVLDVGFMVGFIFVAMVNQNGAGACRGYTDSPFGRRQGQLGDEASWPNMDGLISHVHPHVACELQRASSFISIIVICLFVLSSLAETVLIGHRRRQMQKQAMDVAFKSQNKKTRHPAFRIDCWARLFSPNRKVHANKSDEVSAHGGRSPSPDQANSHGQGTAREATDIDDYFQSQDLEYDDRGTARTGTMSA